MGLLPVSAMFAFLLGFSAHRASICTVAAVAEVMSSGTARVFSGFLKVILWVILINGLMVLFMPELARPFGARSPGMLTVAGGLVFGVGAVVNGGCSFSTISRIAQGNLHVALTLPAFVLGVMAASALFTGMDAGESLMEPLIERHWYRFLVPVLCLWGLWEILKIVTPNLRGGGVWRGMQSERYRLSTGAALVGICSGCLYVMHGRWAYSSRLVDAFVDRPGSQGVNGEVAAWLFIALLAGAVVSAVSNRQFSFSFAADAWLRNIAGGFLMGLGAMLVPGGNGALILQDLPSLSVHAVVAYFSMVLGMAVSLMLFARVTGKSMLVSCDGDLCSVQKDRQN